MVRLGFRVLILDVYSRSPKVGNPIASILKTNVWGIPALFGLHPVSNFMGFTVRRFGLWGFKAVGLALGFECQYDLMFFSLR